MNRTYSYPHNTPTRFFRQKSHNTGRRQIINTVDSSDDDSSDVIYIGQSGPIQPVIANEINDNANKETGKKQKNERSTLCDEMLAEIQKVVYNPEKLRLILTRLKDVNPNDPIFNEFYEQTNDSKS